MSWLKNALKMGWISLRKRKLLSEVLESNAPRDHSGFTRNLQ
jgi:hypothetical protein